MEQGKVTLSRYQRGTDAAERRKIRERSIGSLTVKIGLMEYDALADAKAADLSALVLKHQTATSKFTEWLTSFDCLYLLGVPFVTDFSNPQMVLSAPRKCLTASFQDFSLVQIASWQHFVCEWLTNTDIETSDWILQALDQSIEPLLLMQLKQSHNALPRKQRGGVVLFKLLVDAQNANSYEAMKLYQDFFPDSTTGENVAISISGFIAVASMLRPCNLPTNIIQLLLEGLIYCSNEKFRLIVTAQLGWLSTPAFGEWSRQYGGNRLLLINKLADGLKNQYRSLQQNREWKAYTSNSSSFFKASGPPRQLPPSNSSKLPEGYVHPRDGWKKWFRSQDCQVPGCGQKHPTKYHDDPGIVDRPFKPTGRKYNGSHSPIKSPTKSKTPIRIKKGFNDKFKKRVYNLMECIDDDDNGSADETEDLVKKINLAGEDGPDDEPSMDGDDDQEEDSPAMALAAMGLDSLLNYRAA
jgi:hypothetical protein